MQDYMDLPESRLTLCGICCSLLVLLLLLFRLIKRTICMSGQAWPRAAGLNRAQWAQYQYLTPSNHDIRSHTLARSMILFSSVIRRIELDSAQTHTHMCCAVHDMGKRWRERDREGE